MESNKLTAFLLISMFVISTTANPIIDCGSCGKPPTHHKPTPKPPKVPNIKPPVVKPPITLPPVTLPPIVKPPVNLPPVTIPPVLPPRIVPPILPPGTTKPPTKGKPGKPCPSSATCPIDALKLGACVDLLGGLVHVGLGNPTANKCCRLIAGLVELEAAVCLCSALKLKHLNLNIYVPIALQLLITCGKPPPSGYTCSL